MIVLDTNVASEILKPAPDPAVFQWFQSCPADDFHITTITEAEMLFGIEIMPAGKRRTAIQSVVHEFLRRLTERTLSFDSAAAVAYSKMAADRQRAGRHIDVPDAQIAAICLVHQAPLVTRNASDFEHCGIRLINPWRIDPAAPSPSRPHRAQP